MSEGRTPEVLDEVQQVTALVKSAYLCSYREAVSLNTTYMAAIFKQIGHIVEMSLFQAVISIKHVEVAGIQG